MGRIKQFEEAEVLQKAMMTFWENGYEKTTVRTLEKNMGINQFSIYATFKNKNELYKRALKQYTDLLDQEFLPSLKKQDSTLEDVEIFLKEFACQIIEKKMPNSCMMVESSKNLEKFDSDLKKMILDFFDSMKALFERALTNSKNQGQIPSNTPLHLSAEYLVGIAQSISVYCKIKSVKEVDQYIEFAIEKLR